MALAVADWWRVPREWPGETVFIIGGGPSVPVGRIDELRGRRVIAINDAGLVLAPWADVLFFADQRWLAWNEPDLHLHKGRWKVTRRIVRQPPKGIEIRSVRYSQCMGFSRDPGVISGFCGGGNAINLAYHLGAARIVLMGFDMRPGNWHDRHRAPPLSDQHALKFIPAIERMAPELAADGVDVINATPGSALTCFPVVHPDEVLRCG